MVTQQQCSSLLNHFECSVVFKMVEMLFEKCWEMRVQSERDFKTYMERLHQERATFSGLLMLGHLSQSSTFTLPARCGEGVCAVSVAKLGKTGILAC